jgi:putative hydrolase of the HAD superfamily
MSFSQIRAIAFDADDTLWVNEPFFRRAEQEFCELMKAHLPAEACNKLLFEVEMQNLPLYGYGIKPFTLSLIEAAIRFSDGKVPIAVIDTLIERGKQMLKEPVEVLEGVEDTLKQLNGDYRLVMATKGDLLDQERKLIKSGLERYFHHIEIVSDKTERQYSKLVKHLDVRPEEFLMVGNSVKSDILPVLNIGAHAFHIPFHTTWQHEVVDEPVDHPCFRQLDKATDMLAVLGR